jgi:hypothetical protein
LLKTRRLAPGYTMDNENIDNFIGTVKFS